MKVWWVMAWDTHYPNGGLRNVLETFDTEYEADRYIETQCAGWDNAEVKNVSHMLGIVSYD